MLIFKSLSSLVLLPLLLLGIAVTANNVDLGIQKDFEFQGRGVNIQSYSGWIKWHDQTDLQSLTNSQLLNFAKLAYDRMVELHRSSLQDSEQRPGAMAVLTIGQDMFFASSMKTKYWMWYNSQSSLVGQYLRNCQQLSDSVHRLRLACGEPNVLDVAMLNRNGQTDFSDGRLAIWATYEELGDEECLAPCSTDPRGYGCSTLISQFRISNWVPPVTIPDGTDGNQWASKFSVQTSFERICS